MSTNVFVDPGLPLRSERAGASKMQVFISLWGIGFARLDVEPVFLVGEYAWAGYGAKRSVADLQRVA